MRSANIKNLSIALEALSRVPGHDPSVFAGRIESLLAKEIEFMQEDQTPKYNITPTRKPNDTQDEIPF